MAKPHSYRAATYAAMIPVLTEIAREHGYALGVHGSLHRDLDLIAVPWTSDAQPGEVLIEAIREYMGGKILQTGTPGGRWDAEKGQFVDAVVENPSLRPHGRLAWNIHLDLGFYFDISVMPRQTPELSTGNPT